MKLPAVDFPIIEWAQYQVDRWKTLVAKAEKVEADTGNSGSFEQMVSVLRNMANTGRFEDLPKLLQRRVTARALSWLWLNNDNMGNRLLNISLLEVLFKAQKPRLTRITLQQLAQLYFRRFDQLNEHKGLRLLLEQNLLQQLEKLPASKIKSQYADPLLTLKNEGVWLLSQEGPRKLVEQVQQNESELDDLFNKLGLQGFDDGRYGDICRAHFYLETLRQLPLGQWAPVMDELLKPSVSKAPFEGSRRIGHAALEILIDRAGQEPSEFWQEFILNLAGDPRIASTANNYREWWQPLGEARIQKVRGWLSKEDLRLFLQAVDQYGIESQNQELQRMFPSRKRFLEGLFKLKLIRSTRLLLGSRAQQSVKRILGRDVKTSFATMDGTMSDKAVIYLDCGDFHLVEGSHSFKIWVYLTTPDENLRSYEVNHFTHHYLTKKIHLIYKNNYPSLPYEAITHTPNSWQNKVFLFLANNGIKLDIEEFLSSEDYQFQLRRYGIPMVKGQPPQIRPVAALDSPLMAEMPHEKAKLITNSPNSERELIVTRPLISAQREPVKSDIVPPVTQRQSSSGTLSADLLSHLQKKHAPYTTRGTIVSDENKTMNSVSLLQPAQFSPLQKAILDHLKGKASCTIYELASVTRVLDSTVKSITSILQSDMAAYVQSDSLSYWYLTQEGTKAWHKLFSKKLPVDSSKQIADIEKLSKTSRSIIHYFSTNSGDKARNAAKVMGIETTVINQHLYGELKNMLTKGSDHGWHLTESARRGWISLDKKS